MWVSFAVRECRDCLPTPLTEEVLPLSRFVCRGVRLWFSVHTLNRRGYYTVLCGVHYGDCGAVLILNCDAPSGVCRVGCGLPSTKAVPRPRDCAV